MPTKEPNIIDSFRGLLDDHLGKKEFVGAFEEVLKLVSDLKKSNDQEWTLIHSALQMLEKKLADTSAGELDTFKGEANTLIQSHISAIEDKLKTVDEKLAVVKDGMPGKDADELKIVQDVLAQIQLPEQKETLLDTPEDIRNKLEVLNGDERLSKEAIKGLDDIEKDVQEVKARPRIAGARGVVLYVNGAKKLLSAQTINITGSGVSYAYANGRNDITITGGSGSLSVLAATGTINDSNTVFTFASEPTLVVVNGAMYRHGAGVTIATTTATLDNPVGTGGDIYGMA